MKAIFRSSFLRDLKKLREKSVRSRVKDCVEQVENAAGLSEIPNLIKISGATGHYRIRIGDYRVGLVVEQDAVIFVRCLHRRDIYRYFP